MRRLAALAGLDHVVPLAARGVGEHLGLAREEVGEEAHVVRVVGDDEEIERARELRRLSAGGHDLLAAREAIGIARTEPAASRARIHREGGVQMRVAEERARGEFAIGVGRVRALFERASAASLSSVPASPVGGGFLREERGERQAEDGERGEGGGERRLVFMSVLVRLGNSKMAAMRWMTQNIATLPMA